MKDIVLLESIFSIVCDVFVHHPTLNWPEIMGNRVRLCKSEDARSWALNSDYDYAPSDEEVLTAVAFNDESEDIRAEALNTLLKKKEGSDDPLYFDLVMKFLAANPTGGRSGFNNVY